MKPTYYVYNHIYTYTLYMYINCTETQSLQCCQGAGSAERLVFGAVVAYSNIRSNKSVARPRSIPIIIRAIITPKQPPTPNKQPLLNSQNSENRNPNILPLSPTCGLILPSLLHGTGDRNWEGTLLMTANRPEKY